VLGKQVLLHTIRDKTGKYGRYLAQVYELGEDGALRTELSLNQRLVDAGLAVAYMSKEEI
jgi:endonuclease YncB( thermonuclease family)